MAVSKEVQRNIVNAVMIALVILVFLQPSLFPQPIQQITYKIQEILSIEVLKKSNGQQVVNEGVAMKAVIVDANGNVLQELATISYNTDKPFTIVTKTSGTGYLALGAPPGCVGGCLAFQTALDNSAGDSEVTITSLSADTECSEDNPLYGQIECTGLSNILGPSGVGNGNLDSLWQTEIGAGYVQFRTEDLDYTEYTSSIAFSHTCGGTLEGYGSESAPHLSFDSCNTVGNFDDCTSVLGKVDCLLMENMPGNTPTSPPGDGNWKLYQGEDPDELWLCQDDLDGEGCYIRRYDKDDCGTGQCGVGDCVGLSCSNVPGTQDYESNVCGAGTGIVLPVGEIYPEPPSTIDSESLDLSLIDVGLINFSISVGGTYLDEQGQPQTLTGAGGNVILKISAQECSEDGTEADATLDTDEAQYCLSTPPYIGKYCRIDAYGITTAIDYASYCGCDAGEYALGDVCVPIANCEDTWGADTCEPGGIRYCNAGGTITNECATCGQVNCPVNANGDSATGCAPDTNSICVYPAATGAGFLVDIPEPTIDPITECGDGVKNGAEECDGTDFDGATCENPLGYSGGTLACDGSCNYVETGCFASNVGFRTSSRNFPDAISADNWVAWRSTGCGLDLVGFGYDNKLSKTTESCDTYSLLGTKLINDINSGGTDICDLTHLDHTYVDTEGDGEISVHWSGQYIYLCEDDLGNNRIAYYRYSSGRTNSADTDSDPVTPANEVSC